MSFAGVVDSLLREGLSVRFRASGASMEPSISSGEIVTVEPVAPETARTGDVLLYRDAHRLTAHRLIGRAGAGDTLICQGDGRGSSTEEVVSSRVMGLVTRVGERGRPPRRRFARAAYLFLRNGAARVLK